MIFHFLTIFPFFKAVLLYKYIYIQLPLTDTQNILEIFWKKIDYEFINK